MFIDFVTYLEIRDDLSEEDKQYINSEIKKNMAKYHMEKDGIKYYVETKRPGVGLHLGVEFCISMQHKRYKKYSVCSCWTSNNDEIYSGRNS